MIIIITIIIAVIVVVAIAIIIIVITNIIIIVVSSSPSFLHFVVTVSIFMATLEPDTREGTADIYVTSLLFRNH